MAHRKRSQAKPHHPFGPKEGLSPVGRKPYAVLNYLVHLDKVKNNIEAARAVIINYDAPFWSPIDRTLEPAQFVDRLFSAAKNLSKQPIITELWMEDARILITMVLLIDDQNLHALFAPYTEKLREGLKREPTTIEVPTNLFDWY
ncbi:hypothetical protein AURDEDRAFT_156667 [Auricularia subglabra TFB-10046 SS5]|nr:hypothetical protein AURDEDRAFT_156667 [Auricularia subglabra TFB-10046 SS5]